MKTIKKIYNSPKLNQIIIDNEISMVMSSYADPGEIEPPVGPWGTSTQSSSAFSTYKAETSFSENSPLNDSPFSIQ